MEIVRWFVIAVLLALAAFAGLLAYISLSHIGEAHHDNSTANYLWLGVPAVAVCVVSVVGAVWLWRDPERRFQ